MGRVPKAGQDATGRGGGQHAAGWPRDQTSAYKGWTLTTPAPGSSSAVGLGLASEGAMGRAWRARQDQAWRERRGGISVDTFSPTAKAEAEATASRRPLEGIARGSQHQRTRLAHQFCSGGCGCQAKAPGEWVGTKHEDHACGCGTHNPCKCGGRWWANRYSLSLTVKSDATHRISVGKQRQARLRTMGM